MERNERQEFEVLLLRCLAFLWVGVVAAHYFGYWIGWEQFVR